MKTKSQYVPLPHEYMLIGIIGFFVSIFTIWSMSKTWGFTLAVFCLILFLASVVSMSKAELSDEHIEPLKIHEKSGDDEDGEDSD